MTKNEFKKARKNQVFTATLILADGVSELAIKSLIPGLILISQNQFNPEYSLNTSDISIIDFAYTPSKPGGWIVIANWKFI